MKSIIGFFIAFLLLFCSSCAKPAPSTGGAVPCAEQGFQGSVYMVDASAVTVGREIWFTDENGQIWIWALGNSDAPVNRHVILVLSDNNTPDITDDIIVEWR